MLRCDGDSGTRVRYKITLVTGLLECLCFAGVVFGWASLVFVLKTDGYFSDLCVNVTEAHGTMHEGENENICLQFSGFAYNAGYQALLLSHLSKFTFVRNV